MLIIPLSIEPKLTKKFFVTPENCWQWTGAKNLEGYGVIGINGKNKMARRVMYSLKKREIPNNEFLLSVCENKLCINPLHHFTADETFDLSIIKGEKDDDCWIWTKGKNGRGYGAFNIKGKPRLVHRIMYEKHNGKIPKGMHIMHICDRPICCNPRHLVLGTPEDNMRDMIKKHRDKKSHGNNHFRSTINESLVRLIKIEAQKGLSISDIRKMFNISYTIVWNIYHNKTWRHVKV